MEGNIVANLIRRRDIAVRVNDWNLVRAFDVELARHGIRVVPEKVEDAPATYERAVNPPAKRGRPKKTEEA